jgi:hypothetical protein
MTSRNLDTRFEAVSSEVRTDKASELHTKISLHALEYEKLVLLAKTIAQNELSKLSSIIAVMEKGDNQTTKSKELMQMVLEWGYRAPQDTPQTQKSGVVRCKFFFLVPKSLSLPNSPPNSPHSPSNLSQLLGKIAEVNAKRLASLTDEQKSLYLAQAPLLNDQADAQAQGKYFPLKPVKVTAMAV